MNNNSKAFNPNRYLFISIIINPHIYRQDNIPNPKPTTNIVASNSDII